MMTQRERLMAILRGEEVDRPALNFYEVGGFMVDPSDPDPFNVYNSPDWQPLLQLAEEKTDLIRMMSPVRIQSHASWDDSGNAARKEFFKTETALEDGYRVTRTAVEVAGRVLTSETKREPGLDTIWITEHLLKDSDDLKAYLQLPDEVFEETVEPLKKEEAALGDRGIVMVDTEDPLCAAATLFELGEYCILAMTEPELFHQLLQKVAKPIYRRTEQAAREFPGHLWRVYGPEYACPPYLPPAFFDEYVVDYVKPMQEMIHKSGGFVRIHAHGKTTAVMDAIAGMGTDAIDPLEPAPQGDVDLAAVREKYGDQLVLFGNIEITDIENMHPDRFRELAKRSIEDGTRGSGRGFVLMPSASPYGRDIPAQTMKNYETLVELIGA